MFTCLKHKPKLTLYFDPMLPNLKPSWSIGNTPEIFIQQFRDAKEQLPPEHVMPKTRGRSVTTTAFAYSSHVANKVTRRSHAGFLMFINRDPIMWYSKRQNTVESSTVSSEFIALKACAESITALRCKLRMFGVPVDDSTKVLCDNERVVKNSSKLESSLNKKHCALTYHAVQWAVAASIITVGWIPTDYDIADAFTKRFTVIKRDLQFGSWTC